MPLFEQSQVNYPEIVRCPHSVNIPGVCYDGAGSENRSIHGKGRGMVIHVFHDFGPEKVREDRRGMVERLLIEQFPRTRVTVEHHPDRRFYARMGSSGENYDTSDKQRNVKQAILQAELTFPQE
jgi:hypothetical protein